ncbi:MAG TPA: hypothetical protein DG942_01205 [Ruminococcaceae bacterium]|jgi:hypothetical protein|nr:hypothetical protein [Oscillospiraceae bacterium]
MRIFCQELKKIFSWKVILAVLAVTFFLYSARMKGLVWDTPSSYTKNPEIVLGTEMVHKYGPTVNKAQQLELAEKCREEAAMPLNKRISELQEFRSAKIHNIDEMDALLSKNDDAGMKKYNELSHILEDSLRSSPEGGHLVYLLFYYDTAKLNVDYLQHYDENVKYKIQSAPTEKAKKRVSEVMARPKKSLLPNAPLKNESDGFTECLAVMLLATVMLFIGPYLVRENRSGVRSIAYTCRSGRAVFGTQIAAAAAAAVVAMLVQIAAFLALYFTGPHRVDLPFFGCDISGLYNDINSDTYWWNMTFGQLFVWRGLIMFLIAFGFGLIMFAASRFCKNYIAMLAIMAPVGFGGAKLMVWLFDRLFSILRTQHIEITVCALVVLVPLAACLILLHREKTKEILS